jgi:hypothetical protein
MIKAPPQEGDLSLSADIVTQRYCHVDDEAFTVKMEVRAAKTVQDAEEGNFEYDPNVDYFPGDLPESPRFGEKPDTEHFVILTPHQGYEVTVASAVLGAVVTTKSRKASVLLAKGTHVLQLGVGTWPYQWPYFKSNTDVNRLSERWRNYGHLATGHVYSDFVNLTIPGEFDNPPCETATP